MSWYKVTLSVDQMDEYHTLNELFLQVFMKAPNRREMALFDTGWSPANTHNIYFTPSCAEYPVMKALMDKYGATPCEEPNSETERELGLLAGDTVKWGNHVWCPDL